MSVNVDRDPKILSDFLKYLQRIKNYSIHTVSSYRWDLLCFFDFLKEYLAIGVSVYEFSVFIFMSVKESDIIAFLVYLNFHRNNASSTRQRKLAAIRLFYKWLFNCYPSMSQMVDPTRNIPSVRKTIRIPKYLSLRNARKIQSVFTRENSNYPLRNNLIVSLFLNTGLRLSELSRLNIGDINFEEKFIRVIGKGNKERRVFLNECIKDRLLHYVKSQCQNVSMINLNQPLFMSRLNRRLKNHSIEVICKNAFKLMNLSEEFTTHTLRHTFACIMYEKTRDVFVVKELLGHECLEATQIYTFVSSVALKDAVDSNPLNDFEEFA